MEKSQELFTLEYSSTEEDFEHHPCRFNIEDLPNLHIPSPLQTASSGSETPTSPASYVTSTPETPTTPLTPGSCLVGEFSYINIFSQTSDGVSATSKPPRGKYVKKTSQPRAIPIIDSSHAKRH